MIAILLFIFLAGSVLGAGAALAVAWRLRLIPHTTPTPSGTATTWETIAVPIVNGVLPEDALAAAARIGKALDTRVIVLALLQVPRALNLDASTVPGLERVLIRAENAERIVRTHGAQVHSEVIRVREIGDLVERAGAEVGAGVVVVEANDTSRATRELVQTLVDAKARRSYDVLLVGTSPQREPSAASMAPVARVTS